MGASYICSRQARHALTTPLFFSFFFLCVLLVFQFLILCVYSVRKRGLPGATEGTRRFKSRATEASVRQRDCAGKGKDGRREGQGRRGREKVRGSESEAPARSFQNPGIVRNQQATTAATDNTALSPRVCTYPPCPPLRAPTTPFTVYTTRELACTPRELGGQLYHPR